MFDQRTSRSAKTFIAIAIAIAIAWSGTNQRAQAQSLADCTSQDQTPPGGNPCGCFKDPDMSVNFMVPNEIELGDPISVFPTSLDLDNQTYRQNPQDSDCTDCFFVDCQCPVGGDACGGCFHTVSINPGPVVTGTCAGIAWTPYAPGLYFVCVSAIDTVDACVCGNGDVAAPPCKTVKVKDPFEEIPGEPGSGNGGGTGGGSGGGSGDGDGGGDGSETGTVIVPGDGGEHALGAGENQEDSCGGSADGSPQSTQITFPELGPNAKPEFKIIGDDLGATVDEDGTVTAGQRSGMLTVRATFIIYDGPANDPASAPVEPPEGGDGFYHDIRTQIGGNGGCRTERPS